MTNPGLPRAFTNALYAVGLPRTDAHLLIAFSGGADSMALLHMVMCLSHAQKTPFAFSAVHVHHGIRGAEADRDEVFCRTFCAKNKIPYTAYRVDVPALAAASGRSLEEEAREQRYHLFTRFAEEHPTVTHILTAHHADDQTETVLFRMLRGTTAKGLTGIPLTRDVPLQTRTVALVRPLLSLKKDALLAYCEENALSFVTDSSNLCTDAARNQLRTVLLPAATAINPDFGNALLQLSRELCCDEDYFASVTDDVLGQYRTTDENGRQCFPTAPLLSQHPAIRRRILTRMYRDAGIPTPCNHRHIDAMASILGTQKHAVLSLPDGYRFAVDADSARCMLFRDNCDIREGDQSSAQNDAASELPLLKSGIPIPFGVGVVCRFDENSPETEKKVRDLKNIYKFFISTHINSDKLLGSVFLRSRGETKTDRYLCGGSHKTVRDALSAHKVPRHLRKDIPLICDAGGIVWVPFCGIRDDVNPRLTNAAHETLLYYFYSDERTIST